MNGYLVDTNVISEFIQPVPSASVSQWFSLADPAALFVSVVTLGEIRLGIENMPPSKRRAALEVWLEHGLPEWFESNMLPVTQRIADRWGRMTIQAKRSGSQLTTADGLIAATAFEHGLAVVTRNRKDFVMLDLSIVNPWESPA